MRLPCLAEVFLLGDGANRVNLLLHVARNQLVVATDAVLQINKVVRVADRPHALADLLPHWRQALVLLASGFALLHRLRHTWECLWGTTRAASCGLRVGSLGVRLHLLERLCCLRGRLFGGALFGTQRGRDRLAQLLLHME